MANFCISGLPASDFVHLHGLTDSALAAGHAQRMVVDAHPGYPCRVSLVDAEIGETVYLLPYKHLQVAGPYRASGPVFVREAASDISLPVNTVPLMLRHRVLSLRGYNQEGMMITALVTEGEALESALARLFENQRISYVHIHNAGPGCFNCRVDGVD